MHVHAEITVKKGAVTLFNHKYEFKNIYKEDGSVHKTNENRMLRELKKTRTQLEDTYNIGATENVSLNCEFTTVKQDE